jgi:ribosomal protein L37E
MIDGVKSWNVKTNLYSDNNSLNGLRFIRNKFEGFTLNGSIHKYANEGLHNADDYFLSDLKSTLNKLYLNIGLNPDITTLNGFEFGVNIILPFSPNIALESLILHKSSSGFSDRTGKRFGYQNYIVKIYNKSEQCKNETYKVENILRIEIKVTKMEYLKKNVHCKVFSDLLDVLVWEQLQSLLIDVINDCLIIDLTKTELDMLSDKDRICYLQYINPMFWTNLYNGTRENRSRYGRERAKCNAFIKKNSKSTIQKDILNLVAAKCCELRDVSKTDLIPKKWNKITISQPIRHSERCDKITIFSNGHKRDLCDILPTLQSTNIKEECDILPIKMNGHFVAAEDSKKKGMKRCNGCGEIILHPSKNQLFCSAKVVGYSKAHKCRNTSSNAKKSIRHLLSSPTLFELLEFISEDKRKYLDCVFQ